MSSEGLSIYLSIEDVGLEFPGVVVDPTMTVREQAEYLSRLFNQPQNDRANHPLLYLLGYYSDDNETVILDLEDEHGCELTLADHNIQANDHLHLIAVPKAREKYRIVLTVDGTDEINREIEIDPDMSHEDMIRKFAGDYELPCRKLGNELGFYDKDGLMYVWTLIVNHGEGENAESIFLESSLNKAGIPSGCHIQLGFESCVGTYHTKLLYVLPKSKGPFKRYEIHHYDMWPTYGYVKFAIERTCKELGIQDPENYFLGMFYRNSDNNVSLSKLMETDIWGRQCHVDSNFREEVSRGQVPTLVLMPIKELPENIVKKIMEEGTKFTPEINETANAAVDGGQAGANANREGITI